MDMPIIEDRASQSALLWQVMTVGAEAREGFMRFPHAAYDRSSSGEEASSGPDSACWDRGWYFLWIWSRRSDWTCV